MVSWRKHCPAQNPDDGLQNLLHLSSGAVHSHSLLPLWICCPLRFSTLKTVSPISKQCVCVALDVHLQLYCRETNVHICTFIFCWFSDFLEKLCMCGLCGKKMFQDSHIQFVKILFDWFIPWTRGGSCRSHVITFLCPASLRQ